MRANSVMKYIIFGAVGLGIGWAVAGFFNVALVGITSPMVQPGPGELPAWYLWTDDLPQWAYCFAGACGGAGLGLAMGGWKWAVTLAVAGGIGLGLGLFLLFVVAFLFGLHPIGMASGVGLFGGVTMGLVFGDLGLHHLRGSPSFSVQRGRHMSYKAEHENRIEAIHDVVAQSSRSQAREHRHRRRNNLALRCEYLRVGRLSSLRKQ